MVATQQKYRSARVADELAAAAPGARLVFVQTHSDHDADIRDDWRHCLKTANVGQISNLPLDDMSLRGEQTASPTGQHGALSHAYGHLFFVDSLAALADAQQGRAPRGEFAALIDLLTRQFAGDAAARIRRANFLDLAAEALEQLPASAGRRDAGNPGR